MSSPGLKQSSFTFKDFFCQVCHKDGFQTPVKLIQHMVANHIEDESHKSQVTTRTGLVSHQKVPRTSSIRKQEASTPSSTPIFIDLDAEEDDNTAAVLTPKAKAKSVPVKVISDDLSEAELDDDDAFTNVDIDAMLGTGKAAMGNTDDDTQSQASASDTAVGAGKPTKKGRKKRKKAQSGANTCDYCGKSFTRPDTLRYHLVIHGQGEPFKCELCDETFLRRNLLYMHRRTHAV